MTGPIPPVNDDHPDNDLSDEVESPYCEDYPCCGHEAGDCRGLLYGSDEAIKQAVYDRMDDGYHDDHPHEFGE